MLRTVFMAFFLVCMGAEAHAAKVLLFSECLTFKDDVCTEQNLMAYRFDQGKVTKEEYSRFKIEEKYPYFFMDYDEEQEIVDDRYIVSERIYDLKERKIIHDGYQYEHMRKESEGKISYHGRFLGVQDDQAIYGGGENADEIYVYDLGQHTYKKAEDEQAKALKHGTLQDYFSSDYKDVRVDEVNSAFTLSLITDEGSRVLFRALRTENSGDYLPYDWLDNDRIVTQKSDGEIVIVGLDGTVTPLVKIPLGLSRRKDSYASLYVLDNGLIRYSYNKLRYTINSRTKTFARYIPKKRSPYYSVGDGFEIETKNTTKDGHLKASKYRYDHKIIGEYLGGEAEVTDGHIALMTYTMDGDDYGPLRGLAVWSADSGEWTELEDKSLYALIGWVDIE